MKLFSLLFSKLEYVGLAILSIVSFVVFGRNNVLSRKNQELSKINENQNKTIEVQKKVIEVAKNTKSTDIDGNIERMRKNKL